MSSVKRAFVQQPFSFAAGLISVSLLLSGCQADIVHLRPMAELNQRAQAMMAAGDYAGAIARLESAHDLNPSEPNTSYNLALAYQAADKPMQAIPLIADLLERKPSGAPSTGELQKTMGILWEARGDQLQKAAQLIESDDEKGAKKPAADAAPNERQLEADRAYASAIDYYHQALQTKDLHDSESIKQQVAALEARKNKQAPLSL